MTAVGAERVPSPEIIPAIEPSGQADGLAGPDRGWQPAEWVGLDLGLRSWVALGRGRGFW